MAIGAFPLIKLGALALRQISKPLANHLKVRARSSDLFKNGICIPAGQFYHHMEVHIKARLLNLRRPTEVAKLNEQAAIDLGAELIGEAFMFSIAVGSVLFEYNRQSRKSADEKAALESRLLTIEARGVELETRNANLETKFNSASAELSDLKEQMVKLKK